MIRILAVLAMLIAAVAVFRVTQPEARPAASRLVTEVVTKRVQNPGLGATVRCRDGWVATGGGVVSASTWRSYPIPLVPGLQSAGWQFGIDREYRRNPAAIFAVVCARVQG
jgi:hypothetical protein